MALLPAAARAPARTARALALGFAALAGTWGCPVDGELCPSSTRREADFVIQLAPQGGPGECRVTQGPDGGALDASLFPGLQGFNASLCSSRAADGGALVWLATASFAQPSALGDGGTFTFSNSSTLTGTACSCPIAVTELIEGRLVPVAADAGVELGATGLTPIARLEGRVSDLVAADAPDGGPACRCNLPCATVYDLTAARR